jgi:uncharacterized membrane protein
MNLIKENRIASLDLLKGLVMVIMALDHTRDYFHHGSFLFDPADPEKTNLALFITRWITHYCAPAFSFLAGVSAFLAGRKKSKNELSAFLLKRGIWLVVIEVTVVNFGWRFDIYFESIGLLVIWSLGISMILLAALVHMELKYILLFSLLMIFGHNLLDYVDVAGSHLWSILHEREGFQILNGLTIRVVYPIIPWIGVMSLGYYFGQYYDRNIEPAKRQKLFLTVGWLAIGLFIIVRGVNQYGNPDHWSSYGTLLQTLYSFLNPSKYPPSLTYLLMTLGPSFVFLATTEKVRGRVVDFFIIFGKVPFFYYILHIYFIHFFALILAQATGFGWKAMVIRGFVSNNSELIGYGLDLWLVYLIWVAIVLMLFPLCKRFSVYKLEHTDQWWLSYL